MRRVIDEFDAPRADRRDLSAAAPPRRLLRQRSCRRADAVQFCAAVDAVERAVDREDHRTITSRRLPAGAWPNWVLGNHDRPRVASRVGPEQARVAAMLLLTLRGTPTLYYGDEIGMHQVAIAPDQVRDPFEKNVPGIGVGRDGCRTPMQWDATAHAGFSTATPWLPLADDYAPRERGQSRCRRALDPQPLQGADRACARKLPQLVTGRLRAGRGAGRPPALSPAKRWRGGRRRAESRRRAGFGRRRVRSASAAKSCCRPFSTGRASRSRARSICAAMKA